MIGLLLIDHGSRRAAANAMLHDVVMLVQQLAGRHVCVQPAHMELADPTIAQGFAACVDGGATMVVAVPYMLAPGRHATHDIPALVAQAAQAYAHIPWRVAPPLGVDITLAALVLERASISILDPDSVPLASSAVDLIEYAAVGEMAALNLVPSAEPVDREQ